MDSSVIYIGGFFIMWGTLYLIFAFVGRELGIVQTLFKVPSIFVFLPDRMIVTVGRLFTGAMSIAVGIYLIYNMSLIPS